MAQESDLVEVDTKPVDLPTSRWGLWTMFGTWVVALVVALNSAELPIFITSVVSFVQGDASGIAMVVASPLQLIMVSAIFVVIAVPVAYLVSFAVQKHLGDTDNTVMSLFNRIDEGHHFLAVFLTVLVEELFARWLFFGVIGQFWTGPLAVYTLFFVGNSIWALVHLANIPDRTKRHPMRVLSQFVSGALLTVIYLRYGFMAVLLVHLAFDALALSHNKRQMWGRTSAKAGVYCAVVAGASAVAMGTVTHTNLLAAASWLTVQPQFAVAGWGFWDYVLASIFVGATLRVGLELLAFDHDNLSVMGKGRPGQLSLLIGNVIVTLVMLGAYYLLGLIMPNEPHRLIVLAFLLMLVLTQNSGSAMARTFWLRLPELFITIGCVIGLGFWAGLLYLLIGNVVYAPLNRIVGKGTTLVTEPLVPANLKG